MGSANGASCGKTPRVVDPAVGGGLASLPTRAGAPFTFGLACSCPLPSIVPFVVALLRTSVDVDSGAAGEPEEIVLHDRMVMVLGLIWAACLLGSVYFYARTL